MKAQNSPVSKTNTIDNQQTKDLFEFIQKEHSQSFDIGGLFSLLPETQGENYEEAQFAKRVKKKKKGRNL